MLWFVEAGCLYAVVEGGSEKSIIIEFPPTFSSSSAPIRLPEKGDAECWCTGDADEMALDGCESPRTGDVLCSLEAALGMFVSDALRMSRPPIPCFCLNFSSHDGLLILVSASLKGRAYMRACSWISESDTCRPLCCSLRNQLANVLSMSGILPLAFLMGELLRSSGFSHLSLRLRTLDTVLLSWLANNDLPCLARIFKMIASWFSSCSPPLYSKKGANFRLLH